MHPARVLIGMRWAILRNRARDLHRDAVAKLLVITIGLGLVAGVAHQVSLWSFMFIESFPAIGAPLADRLLSLFLLILLVMVTLSTAVIVYATLFLTAETEFLFANPILPRWTFFTKVFESVGFSAWATMVLGVPVLFAFGRARSAPPLFYFEAVATLALFLAFCGLVGSSLMLVLLEVVRRWTWRRLVVLGLLLIVLPGWLFLRTFEFSGLSGEENLQVLDRFTAGIAAIRSEFFPGHWASSCVVAAAAGQSEEVHFYFSLLLANTLIFIPLLALYGRYRYGRRWLIARNPPPARRRKPGDLRPAARRIRTMKTPLAALNRKDFITFVRDPAQLSQFLLFVLLLVVYVMSLLRIPHDLFSGGWRKVIYFANLGAISLILSSFTSRFLFPLPSLEGRCFWIVGLAPVDRTFLLRQKAILGRTVILILGLCAALSSSLFLGFRGAPLMQALYIIALVGWCLTSLSAGLGAAYPNFTEDNPARIAVGLGGTLNFFFSAAAIVVLLFLEGAPSLVFRSGPPPLALEWAAHALALAFAIAISWYSLRVGRRSLQAMEF